MKVISKSRLAMPEKTQEQRIADAVAQLNAQKGVWSMSTEELVAAVLEAADAPPKPAWPTDESLDADMKVVNDAYPTREFGL